MSVIEIILNMPIAQFALRIFISVGALLLLVAGVMFVCHIAGVVNISKNGIEWKGFKRKKKSPHEDCENWNDVVLLLTKQAEMLDTIHEKEKRMTKAQRLFAKAVASKMRGDAQRVFLTLLKNSLHRSDDDKTGLLNDAGAGAEFTTLDFSNGFKKLKNGTTGKVIDAVKKLF